MSILNEIYEAINEARYQWCMKNPTEPDLVIYLQREAFMDLQRDAPPNMIRADTEKRTIMGIPFYTVLDSKHPRISVNYR